MNDWISIKDHLPPEGVAVETCVWDESGIRNRQELKCYGRGRRDLWFLPGEGVYVSAPTHWRNK